MRLVGIFLLIVFAFGVAAFYEIKAEDDSAEVEAFIASKGKTPFPKSWKGQLGKGI